jgi:hypothetical protein
LDRDGWRRLVLAGVTFILVIVSTVRLSQIKLWVWPSVLLMLVNMAFVVAGNTFRSRALTGIRWGFLAAFFALVALLIEKHCQLLAQLLSRDSEIDHLKLVIAKLLRMMFGAKSERVAREIEQLELKLEDLETVRAVRAAPRMRGGSRRLYLFVSRHELTNF